MNSNFVVSVDKLDKMSCKGYRKLDRKPVKLWGFYITAHLHPGSHMHTYFECFKVPLHGEVGTTNCRNFDTNLVIFIL